MATPDAALTASASAPGKVILFGEHAVVYGEPAIATAIQLRTQVWVDHEPDHPACTVNGRPMHARAHSYLMTAVDRLWRAGDREGGLAIRTLSKVPSSSGTGSSAALSTACVAALLALTGERDPARVARAAFEVERETQAGGSPTDTSTATAGGGLLAAQEGHHPGTGTDLWTLAWQDRRWRITAVPVPDLPLVVVNSGDRSSTSHEVAKVRRAFQGSGLVRDTVRDIGLLVGAALEALAARDLGRLGDLMNRNQVLLHTLGVSTPRLDSLLETAQRTRGTLGAKITGAGGGGSILVLTDEVERLVAAMQERGAHAIPVQTGRPGVSWHG